MARKNKKQDIEYLLLAVWLNDHFGGYSRDQQGSVLILLRV